MNANQSQSIIKLPLIFIVFLILLDFFVPISVSFFTNPEGIIDSYFQYIKDSFNYYIFCFYCNFGFYILFFVTAILCCQTYRLHLLRRDLWRVLIIATVLFGTSHKLIHLLYELKIKCDDFIIHNFSFIFDKYRTIGLGDFFRWFIRLISSINIFTAIIFFINLVFYVFAKKNLNLRQTFQADLSEKNKINCFNYSVLMIIPSAMFVIINNFQSFVDILLHKNYQLMFINIFGSLLTILIQYLVTYFSVYKTFSSIDSLINIKKLIISMLLCVTISSFLCGVLPICIYEIILRNKLRASYKSINFENLNAIILGCIICSYLVVSCILSRYLVKRICVDNS